MRCLELHRRVGRVRMLRVLGYMRLRVLGYVRLRVLGVLRVPAIWRCHVRLRVLRLHRRSKLSHWRRRWCSAVEWSTALWRKWTRQASVSLARVDMRRREARRRHCSSRHRARRHRHPCHRGGHPWTLGGSHTAEGMRELLCVLLTGGEIAQEGIDRLARPPRRRRRRRRRCRLYSLISGIVWAAVVAR